MSGSIVFNPNLPVWALAIVALLSLVAGALSLWRSPRGGVLRIVALAGLFGLLLDPQVRTTEKTPLNDIAIIVADRSESQSLNNRTQATDAAIEQLENRIAALGAIETQIVDVDGAEETRLVEAISAAIADSPRARTAGVFVVTDGQASDAANADFALKAAEDIPVHVMTTGTETEVDRKITLINAPHYGIVRDKVTISFRIDDFGRDNALRPNARQVVVALRIDGEEAFRQPVPLGSEVSFDAPLDRPGELVIELEVEELPGELTTRNNIAVLPITAIRDRLRTLLISGEPHPGERVWRNLLKSDPAIDLVHFTILRPLEKNDGALQNELALIEFPQDELFIEKLSEFDLLIFDRYTYRRVMNAFHFDNIARYVEEGGAVLIASGPEYNGPQSLAARRNLSFILPALPEGDALAQPFRPLISKEGARHPVTARLPEENLWGRWLRIMPVAQRSGATLMEGPRGEPLLILDRVGEGRVGLLLSDHVWLWARGFDGGGPHAELLRRIAHWLMKEPELEEEQLTLTPLGEDLRIERRSLSEEIPPVVLTLPDGDERVLTLEEGAPGLFRTILQNAPRGLYRAKSGDLFAVGAVGLAAAPEFADVVASPSTVAPIAETTRGGQFSIRRGDDVALPALRRVREGANVRAGPGWAGVVTRNAARIDAVTATPLASPWAWLALMAAALVGAWWIEGRASPSSAARPNP
ncbi:MAG: hypothetical protein AAGJ73_04885 [Pseudomonadota bacterium]